MCGGYVRTLVSSTITVLLSPNRSEESCLDIAPPAFLLLSLLKSTVGLYQTFFILDSLCKKNTHPAQHHGDLLPLPPHGPLLLQDSACRFPLRMIKLSAIQIERNLARLLLVLVLVQVPLLFSDLVLGTWLMASKVGLD